MIEADINVLLPIIALSYRGKGVLSTFYHRRIVLNDFVLKEYHISVVVKVLKLNEVKDFLSYIQLYIWKSIVFL